VIPGDGSRFPLDSASEIRNLRADQAIDALLSMGVGSDRRLDLWSDRTSTSDESNTLEFRPTNLESHDESDAHKEAEIT